MRIIGLTGGTGSGKSAVSTILLKKGAAIIDADAIAHDIILKGTLAYNELVEYFGNEILDENGEIIRRRLGAVVFADGGKKLEFLNTCTHKYIYLELQNQLEKHEKLGKTTAVIDAPLLLDGNFRNLCSEIWVVYADESVRLKRIMARDGIDEASGRNRMAAQKSWEEYKKMADVVIDNSSDMANVEIQINKYFQMD